MAQAVDLPAWIFVVPRRTGTERGVEADFAESAGGVAGAGDTRGIGVVSHAGAGDRAKRQPVSARERSGQRVIGVEPVRAEPWTAEGWVLAQHGDARTEALVEAVAYRQRQQVEAQFGQTLLHALKRIRLKAREQGDEGVGARIGGFDEGVGFLHGEKCPRAEVAEDFGVFPPIELRGEREIFSEFLFVLPFHVAAVFRHRAAERVEFFVAMVVDVAGSKVAAKSGVAGGPVDAAVAPRWAEHHSAGRINSEVAPEAQLGRRRSLQSGFGKRAQRRAEAAVERRESDEGLFKVLLETSEGQRLRVADADPDVFAPEALTWDVDDLVGEKGRLPRAGFAISDGRTGQGNLFEGARGGGGLGVVGMCAEPNSLGSEALVASSDDDFIGEQADFETGEDGVADRGDGRGLGVEADLVGGDERDPVGRAGVSPQDVFFGLAVERGCFRCQDEFLLRLKPRRGESDEYENYEAANHARSKGGAAVASKLPRRRGA